MKWNVWHIPSGNWLSYKSFGRRAAAQDMVDNVYTTKVGGGYSRDELEVRPVYPMMEQHGTTLIKLKPSMIWDCAMADLARRDCNKDYPPGKPEHYAFHRRHVEKAESANDIIRAAIADPGRGQRSAKRDTRLLYADVELLKAALR